jgi:hypothetical protein
LTFWFAFAVDSYSCYNSCCILAKRKTHRYFESLFSQARPPPYHILSVQAQGSYSVAVFHIHVARRLADLSSWLLICAAQRATCRFWRTKTHCSRSCRTNPILISALFLPTARARDISSFNTSDHSGLCTYRYVTTTSIPST